ncbi:MAG: fatty acid desaturase [Alphaproteobacteria bacterium]|nr:fatty acid desaturase [Alphaproteobacteria bacterium]
MAMTTALQRSTPETASAAAVSSHGISAITPADEKRIAKELSPPVAWPTLAMALALPLAYLVTAAVGLSHVLPLWICALMLIPISYAHYTLVHESIHGNLVPAFPKLRWLNSAVGWIGALGLGYNWPVLMRTHAQHHAYTNTDKDPDIIVKGSLNALVLKWLKYYIVYASVPLFLGEYLAPAEYQRVAGALREAEIWQASAIGFLMIIAAILSIHFGYGVDWLFLLFIPTRIAALILNIFFQWLPHHPFDRSERYVNTRISLWPGGTFLTLQQNLHLMHHLWPSVPFYNYVKLYARLRPLLIAKGSPIQGLMVGRHAYDLSRD